MVQRLIINGEEEIIELFPKVLENKPEENYRKWALENGKIGLKFTEQPLGKIKDFVYPDSLSLDKDTEAELKTRIFEIIDNHNEQERSGIEPDNHENKPPSSYPYDVKEIIINNHNWSVDYIFKLLKKEIIELSPDFQRNFVWDYKRKCRLIESILLGIPIPAFYLAKTDTGYHVVDGLQRLTTIKQFLNNEFPLKYLEYLNKSQDDMNNLEGLYYKTDGKKKGLPDEYDFRLLSAQFNINIIDAHTHIQVKFDVFRRINTGGKPLNNQEMRNCLMETATRKLINEMAESEAFAKATDNSITTTRMNAQELVMRFVGFWYIKILKKEDLTYQGDMQGFLDEMVQVLNDDKERYHEIIIKDFNDAMQNAFYLYGKYCFRKCLPEHLKKGAKRQLINKSLFTTWSVLLCRLDINSIEKEVSKKGNFIHVLSNALNEKNEGEEPSYFELVSHKTNDKKVLELAFSKTHNLIQKQLLNNEK